MIGRAVLDDRWVHDLLAGVVERLPEPTLDLGALDLGALDAAAFDGGPAVLAVAARVVGTATLAGYGALLSYRRLGTPAWHVDERVYAVAGRAYWGATSGSTRSTRRSARS